MCFGTVYTHVINFGLLISVKGTPLQSGHVAGTKPLLWYQNPLSISNLLKHCSLSVELGKALQTAGQPR